MVDDAQWTLEEVDVSGMKDWFNKKHRDFTAWGRDMEKLWTFVKIAHSRRMYGQPVEMRKTITVADLNAGYEQWKGHRKKSSTNAEDTRHQFYFV
jgi:hypothetical protein